MGRAGREVWAKRVARWHDSGLTAKEYGAETGVNANTLSHWAWKLHGKTRPARTATAEQAPPPMRDSEWVELTPPLEAPETPIAATPAAAVTEQPAVADAFELVLAGGRMLCIPTNFDTEALRRLLGVLGER